jgi:OmpA-OmpF porin, OOP family
MLLRLSRRARVLASLLVSCPPVATIAQTTPGSWYVNPDVGGIIPDKPWGARGSAPLFGLDLGRSLTGGWSTELDVTYARLDDRRGSSHSSLEGAALQAVRIFDFGARVLPYASLGAGMTHEAPGAGSGLLTRTEFMVQPGLGVLVRLWDAHGSGLALRADFEARWTHGWAHAPGNPVDPLYRLGLSYYFGGPRTPQP